MNIDKPPVSDERIAFEAWYSASQTSACLVRTGKGYINETTRVAWRAWQAAQRRECGRICEAIKQEDDYCVDNGDYMLDSDDCIAVARGEWKRPDFSVDAAKPKDRP
jgi:hypothetical protein